MSDEHVQFDTIDYATPYALNLHSELMGLPLAKPWKRLLALCVDGVILAALSTIHPVVMWIGLTYIFFRMTGKKRRDLSFFSSTTGGRFTSFMRIAIRIASGISLLIFLIVGLLILKQKFFDDHPAPNPPAAQTQNLPPINSATQIPSPRAATDSPATQNETRKPLDARLLSVVAVGRSALADLGLGFGWGAMYFTLFVSVWRGQTPGKKLLGIRVIRLDNKAMSLWDAFGRYGGYTAGFATGLLGFLQVFWDPNRQAIQDKIAGSLVIDLRKPRTSPEDIRQSARPGPASSP